MFSFFFFVFSFGSWSVVVVVRTLFHRHNTKKSVVTGQAPVSKSGVAEYLGGDRNRQRIIDARTGPHLSSSAPQTKKVRSAHARRRLNGEISGGWGGRELLNRGHACESLTRVNRGDGRQVRRVDDGCGWLYVLRRQTGKSWHREGGDHLNQYFTRGGVYQLGFDIFSEVIEFKDYTWYMLLHTAVAGTSVKCG